jgi:hypothetical protein
MTFRAPIDKVFEFFADRNRYPRSKTVMSLEQIPAGPVALGSIFKVHYHRRNIDVLWTIDEFEPPCRLRFRIEWPREAPMFEAYTLRAAGDTTVVLHQGGSLALSPLPIRKRLSFLAMRPLYALLAPLGLWMMRRRIERDLPSRDIPLR